MTHPGPRPATAQRPGAARHQAREDSCKSRRRRRRWHRRSEDSESRRLSLRRVESLLRGDERLPRHAVGARCHGPRPPRHRAVRDQAEKAKLQRIEITASEPIDVIAADREPLLEPLRLRPVGRQQLTRCSRTTIAPSTESRCSADAPPDRTYRTSPRTMRRRSAPAAAVRVGRGTEHEAVVVRPTAAPLERQVEKASTSGGRFGRRGRRYAAPGTPPPLGSQRVASPPPGDTVPTKVRMSSGGAVFGRCNRLVVPLVVPAPRGAGANPHGCG